MKCTCKREPVKIRVLAPCLVVDFEGEALARAVGDIVTINKNHHGFNVLIGYHKAEVVEA